MSYSTRFIAIALVGWVAVRAVSLGLVPGGQALAFDRPATPASSTSPALPAIATTDFAPVEPVAEVPPQPPYYPATPRPYPVPYAVPYPVAAGQSRGPALVHYAASPAPALRWGPPGTEALSLSDAAVRYAGNTLPLDQWPLAAIASGRSTPLPRNAITQAAALIRAIPGIDRLSMSAWAMMRRSPGAPSLATNGQLGGSQAGTRLLWRFDRHFAASLRSSAPIDGTQRTAEFAAGLRWQPLQTLPIALTAERRQSLGRYHGPSGFALFAEGGVYDRPIVAGFALDAYLQAGVVGVHRRAGFVDGSATLTRPVWRQLSAGAGLWGGAQPGLARLDAGPRLTWRIGHALRAHLDYRQRLVGHAAPGSGPVLTLAGDF